MKNFFLLLLLVPAALYSQIRGKVTDRDGNALPFVSVFLENSFKGTTTNDQGLYELSIYSQGSYTIVFQFLGYQTRKVTVTVESFPHTLDVSMQDENIVLREVVINPNDNPANAIVRNAVQARSANTEKLRKFRCDFYSRGIFRIRNAPKRVLGARIDMFDEMLDSTRSGILYLSETVSKLAYQKPDKLKETIIASKVSGNDNGFSFNNAASADFDFYDNTIALSSSIISPIASNAFNYYKYRLEGSFFDEDNHQIHKIKVTPRRNTEPCMEGYIYIVDESWALYGVDLSVKGNNIQLPALTLLTLKQNFSFNSSEDTWAKTSQVLDFQLSLFGMNVSGRFTYVYSNFEFPDQFAKKTFGPEVLVFQEGANKKDSTFWSSARPVPLTDEEVRDYAKKALLQQRKESRSYLDSLDRVKNKFKVLDLITGYTYNRSFRKLSYRYDGIVSGLGFNTVQGYNISTGFSATKRNEEKRTFTTIGTRMNYGFSEDRFRLNGFIARRFNNINDLEIEVAGGSAVQQFNPANPIGRIVNSIATSFFRDNYMKLFDRTFASITYKQELFNGFHLTSTLNYDWRKPLFNTTDESIVRNDRGYTSNNPLEPQNFTSVPFERHSLARANVTARISFGQQYWTRPDGKFNIRNEKYPTLFVTYEKGFAASDEKYSFDHLAARIFYDIGLGNKGQLGVNLRAGRFFNADQIAFADFKHFNGNQTHIGQADRYLNVFNLMPYYDFSTNKQYAEAHAEYSDQGYILNKIPLLNKLQANLVLGYHLAATPDITPYSEYSVGLDNLGFGKIKFFRLDYVRAYQGENFLYDGVIFGLKFLNILE